METVGTLACICKVCRSMASSPASPRIDIARGGGASMAMIGDAWRWRICFSRHPSCENAGLGFFHPLIMRSWSTPTLTSSNFSMKLLPRERVCGGPPFLELPDPWSNSSNRHGEMKHHQPPLHIPAHLVVHLTGLGCLQHISGLAVEEVW